MEVEFLISCMHEKDASIVEKTNIQSDVIVINQCNRNSIDNLVFYSKNGEKHKAKLISTTERGLSKSRNMALKNATNGICMICDDDEYLFDNCIENIKDAYKRLKDADLIVFKMEYDKTYPIKEKKIGYLSALKIASWQISFKRSSIISKNIFFDESIGSGVSKAGGEEVLFLYKCLKSKLNIYYVPICIGKVNKSTVETSVWFKGYNKEYFYDRGIFTRKLLGLTGSILYSIYFAITKYKLYSNNISIFNALYLMIKGSLKK